MVGWTATRTELKLIKLICDRYADRGKQFDRMNLSMDLDAVHSNGCPLDFQGLLRSKESDFMHDIHGIGKNIDRHTGRLSDCFVPRCAKSD